MPARSLAAVCLFLLCAAPARADIEAQATMLEHELIAPCCFTQQVALHHSAAADELRRDIRRRLASGETPPQIRAAYVARYGKRILAQPPAEGVASLLYVVPPLVLLLTIASLVLAVRRFVQPALDRNAAAASPGEPDTDAAFGRAVDAQLREME
jgi:cytochrome c-type biogenesis protein CcmH/NrfF